MSGNAREKDGHECMGVLARSEVSATDGHASGRRSYIGLDERVGRGP